MSSSDLDKDYMSSADISRFLDDKFDGASNYMVRIGIIVDMFVEKTLDLYTPDEVSEILASLSVEGYTVIWLDVLRYDGKKIVEFEVTKSPNYDTNIDFNVIASTINYVRE